MAAGARDAGCGPARTGEPELETLAREGASLPVGSAERDEHYRQISD